MRDGFKRLCQEVNLSSLKKGSRMINKIVIHTTASYNNYRCEDIDFDHKNNRGWRGIGYNFLVYQNKIVYGRDIDIIPAHTKGFNRYSIGVAWTGGIDPITSEQYQNLIDFTKHLMKIYNLDVSQIYGHYELNNHKDCPLLDMNKFRKDLKTNSFIRKIRKGGIPVKKIVSNKILKWGLALILASALSYFGIVDSNEAEQIKSIILG